MYLSLQKLIKLYCKKHLLIGLTLLINAYAHFIKHFFSVQILHQFVFG